MEDAHWRMLTGRRSVEDAQWSRLTGGQRMEDAQWKTLGGGRYLVRPYIQVDKVKRTMNGTTTCGRLSVDSL